MRAIILCVAVLFLTSSCQGFTLRYSSLQRATREAKSGVLNPKRNQDRFFRQTFLLANENDEEEGNGKGGDGEEGEEEVPAVTGAGTGNSGGGLSDAQLARDFQEAVKERSRTFGTGKLAGNTTLDDRGIYADLKRAVLNTPDSLARTQSTQDQTQKKQPNENPDEPNVLPNVPQMITQPSSAQTPSDCIIAVLDALQSNNSPLKNHGIQVLFAFTSPASASVGSDVEDFATYIPNSKYSILLNWDERIFEKKIDYNPDKTKAYINIKIRDKDSKMEYC